MSFDFEKFKVTKGRPKLKAQNPQKKYFIRSMDYGWIRQAAALPGRALHIGIGIWFHAGLYRKRFDQPFFVSVSRIARDFNIKPATARRGFKALETKGLLSVHRRSGRKSEVTLLDPAAPLQSGSDQDTNPATLFDIPQNERGIPPEGSGGAL